MAEKHKSKYKRPENAKPTRRKDIKDYSCDDKDGKLNPYSTGKKQEKVARKIDKPYVDDSTNMTVKMTDKDRLYKKIEDGEYDPKHAMKVLSKRQETDTDEYFDAREKIDHGVTTSELDERISKLSSKQKEKLVREYIRRKIVKILREQPEPTPAPEEDPVDAAAPPADAAAPPAPDAVAPPAPAPEAPAPDASAAIPSPSTPAPAATASAVEPSAEKEKSPEEKEAEKIITVKKWLEYLKTKQEKGPTTLIQTAVAPLAAMIKRLSPEDAARAKKLAIRQIRNITIEPVSDEEEESES